MKTEVVMFAGGPRDRKMLEVPAPAKLELKVPLLTPVTRVLSEEGVSLTIRYGAYQMRRDIRTYEPAGAKLFPTYVWLGEQ